MGYSFATVSSRDLEERHLNFLKRRNEQVGPLADIAQRNLLQMAQAPQRPASPQTGFGGAQGFLPPALQPDFGLMRPQAQGGPQPGFNATLPQLVSPQQMQGNIATAFAPQGAFSRFPQAGPPQQLQDIGAQRAREFAQQIQLDQSEINALNTAGVSAEDFLNIVSGVMAGEFSVRGKPPSTSEKLGELIGRGAPVRAEVFSGTARRADLDDTFDRASQAYKELTGKELRDEGTILPQETRTAGTGTAILDPSNQAANVFRVEQEQIASRTRGPITAALKAANVPGADTIGKFTAEVFVPTTLAPFIGQAGKAGKALPLAQRLTNFAVRGAQEGIINMRQDEAGRAERGEEAPSDAERAFMFAAGAVFGGGAPEFMEKFGKPALRILLQRFKRALGRGMDPESATALVIADVIDADGIIDAEFVRIFEETIPADRLRLSSPQLPGEAPTIPLGETQRLTSGSPQLPGRAATQPAETIPLGQAPQARIPQVAESRAGDINLPARLGATNRIQSVLDLPAEVFTGDIQRIMQEGAAEVARIAPRAATPVPAPRPPAAPSPRVTPAPRAAVPEQAVAPPAEVTTVATEATARAVESAPVPPQAAGAAPQLPARLSASKPRFNIGRNSFQPQFANDTDKALFIVAKPKTSARDAEFIRFLKGQFPDASIGELRAAGKEVSASIKAAAKVQGTEGTLDIPATGIRPKSTKPVAQGAGASTKASADPDVVEALDKVAEAPDSSVARGDLAEVESASAKADAKLETDVVNEDIDAILKRATDICEKL